MDDRIDIAFKKVPRENFLPEPAKSRADIDAPVAIGYGQTNSQPYTVRLMLGWLDARPGQKVLDVGSGSGWTTALLAELVGQTGEVHAVEKLPQLVKFGQNNVSKLGYENVQFHQAGKKFGWPGAAPYDRILVSASAQQLPPEPLEQLKVGGKIVIPVQTSILVIDKTGPDDYDTKEHPGFAFVPLV